MGETLFISDLHLFEGRPATLALFRRFMEERAPDAEALYVMGDLFEAWVGDDDPSHINRQVETWIRALVEKSTEVYFMHGNRDFLITEAFAERTGCQLIEDPSTIDLYGTRTLLMHGDSLCTDDAAHQAYRAVAYSDAWKRTMLDRPLEERLAIGKKYRQASVAGNKLKSSEIMDVNENTVRSVMHEHGVQRLIHGHTHRPTVHNFALDGKPAQRFVLADWDTRGCVLCWNEQGYWVEWIDPPE